MDVNSLLERLFDEGSYVSTSFGKIAGNGVYVYTQDINVKSGAVNAQSAAKMKKIYANAVKFGAPLISVWNSKGGEITEGLELASAYSEIIADAARLSGVVPLISVVTGQCSGLNAAICRMADFVIATEDAEIFFTPPFLGGEKEAADIAVKTAEDAALKARELLSILPPNNLEVAYSSGEFKIGGQIKFGEINGFTAGFVTLDGKLANSYKIAKFIKFCDNFSIPVVTVINSEGFEAGVSSREIARLAQVYASMTAPKITLLTERAAGAPLILSGGDFVIAYEDAVISPIPVKTAAAFLEMSEADYIAAHANVQSALEKGYIDMVITPEQEQTALMTALEIVRSKRVASVPRKRGI
jgi:acetyl-CoA carboxylase carboxyltransferase component